MKQKHLLNQFQTTLLHLVLQASAMRDVCQISPNRPAWNPYHICTKHINVFRIRNMHTSDSENSQAQYLANSRSVYKRFPQGAA